MDVCMTIAVDCFRNVELGFASGRTGPNATGDKRDLPAAEDNPNTV